MRGIKSAMPGREDLTTAAGALAFAASHFDWMREVLAERGQFLPMVVLLARRHPRTGEEFGRVEVLPIMFADMGDDEQKDGNAGAVRSLAIKSCAVGVLFCMEAWCLQTKSAEERSNYPRSLEHAPGRTEHLQVTLEHAALPASCCWVAEIARDAEGRPRASEFQKLEGAAIGGRFAGFLPPEMRQ